MTNKQLDALEAAAKAATPGPWRIKRGYCLYDERDMHVVSAWENYSGSLGLNITSEEAMANARFLELTNPAAILELIAELRKEQWYVQIWIARAFWLAQQLESKDIPYEEWLQKAIDDVDKDISEFEKMLGGIKHD